MAAIAVAQNIRINQQISLSSFWGRIENVTTVASIAALHFFPGGINLASTLGLLSSRVGVFSIQNTIRAWSLPANNPTLNARLFRNALFHTCAVAFQCFSLLYVVFKESAQANLLSRFAFGFSFGLGISGIQNLIQHFGSKQRQYRHFALMEFDPDFQNSLHDPINEETILTQANAFIDQHAREERFDLADIQIVDYSEDLADENFLDFIRSLDHFCEAKKKFISQDKLHLILGIVKIGAATASFFIGGGAGIATAFIASNLLRFTYEKFAKRGVGKIYDPIMAAWFQPNFRACLKKIAEHWNEGAEQDSKGYVFRHIEQIFADFKSDRRFAGSEI